MCVGFISCALMVLFFFHDTATTEINTYCHTLPLHDFLPISTSALATLLATLRPDGCTATAHIDDGWMQGRTAYGGISSAVALAATMALHPTDTPLRYA